MRDRFTVLSALIVLLGTLTAGLPLVVSAQEASPLPGGFEITPGVTAEALAFAPGAQAPSLYLLTFAPGVTYRAEPAPEIALGYLETGTLSLTKEAPVAVFRAGAADAPAETIPADTDFTVQAGDYMVLPLFAAGEVRDAGTAPASLMVVSIVPE